MSEEKKYSSVRVGTATAKRLERVTDILSHYYTRDWDDTKLPIKPPEEILSWKKTSREDVINFGLAFIEHHLNIKEDPNCIQ